jgi:hypothetical protein
MVQLGRPQVTIWRMHIACCVHKATDTRSEYVILIALPQQQWLHECASMLCYMYVACLVCIWMYIHHIQMR